MTPPQSGWRRTDPKSLGPATRVCFTTRWAESKRMGGIGDPALKSAARTVEEESVGKRTIPKEEQSEVDWRQFGPCSCRERSSVQVKT